MAPIVVLDNRSGDVLALVGSENYFAPAAGQVNGAWAPRSPGSTFKPFTYLLALERGATPATVVADVPTEFATATGLFAPVNYDRHCYGPMRYRLALANSLNISAVKVLASLGGPEPLQQLLQQCGLSTLGRPAEHYGLGLTIGNAEARLLELANAYACLARLGEYKPYRLLLDSSGGWGSPISDSRRPTARRVADPAAAYLIADILSDNDARTLAFGAESPLRFDFPVACKTGTSSDFRDNWAFGYTPEFTVGIWVGNFDGSPMKHSLRRHRRGAAPARPGRAPAPAVRHHLVFGPDQRCRVLDPPRHRQAPGPTRRAAKPGRHQGEVPGIKSSSPREPGRLRDHGHSITSRRCGSATNTATGWPAATTGWATAPCSPPRGTRCASFSLCPAPSSTWTPTCLQQGRRLRLRADGPDDLQWHSDSLQIAREGSRQIALLTAGRHQLTVRDPLTGAQANTWLDVLAR